MNIGRIIIAVAAMGAIVAADPALARAKHKAKPHCVDGPRAFSWSFLLPGSPTPQPNIRHQLQRDPGTGYAPL
jgi:hypothetical protein